jgi:hypothetical protein
MKRSVFKATTFRLSTEPNFYIFVFTFSILKAKLKNLAVFANKHKPFGLALTSYVLYTVLAIVISFLNS